MLGLRTRDAALPLSLSLAGSSPTSSFVITSVLTCTPAATDTLLESDVRLLILDSVRANVVGCWTAEPTCDPSDERNELHPTTALVFLMGFRDASVVTSESGYRAPVAKGRSAVLARQLAACGITY